MTLSKIVVVFCSEIGNFGNCCVFLTVCTKTTASQWKLTQLQSGSLSLRLPNDL